MLNSVEAGYGYEKMVLILLILSFVLLIIVTILCYVLNLNVFVFTREFVELAGFKRCSFTIHRKDLIAGFDVAM